MDNQKYVLISPCRDEAEYMRTTLDSVVGQTVCPYLWIIVDDGSTDETPNILSEYSNKYDYIKVVKRENRGHRSVGPGVIEAFYSGYEQIGDIEYDYICKLDLDLDLPIGYFEALLKKFNENPRLGTCSGKPYFYGKSGKLISEKCGDENSVGMTKMFRRECFEQIGGFVRQVMWDAIDGHKCRMLGWIAASWDEPQLRFIHLRPMGSSHKGILTGRMRHGFGQYFMGTSFLYMTVSALYRVSRPPYFIGGFGMWIGYMKSFVTRAERLEDPVFRKFLRSYQSACLLKGKTNATLLFDEKSSRYWKPADGEAG